MEVKDVESFIISLIFSICKGVQPDQGVVPPEHIQLTKYL